MHGHSYRIAIHVSGDVDPEDGWVVDYADAGAARPFEGRCARDKYVWVRVQGWAMLMTPSLGRRSPTVREHAVP